MKLHDAIRQASTKTDLKRFCSAYVVDHRNLKDEELIPALDKAAPQYFHRPNVESALHDCRFDPDRNLRLITDVLLREVLLEADDAQMERSDADDEVLKYEQAGLS